MNRVDALRKNKVQVALSLSLILCACYAVSAGAKQIGKYQTMTPIFDSSLPKPKVFELKVKHTDMFEPPVELHGETKLIELQAKEDATEPLRGQVSTEEKLQPSTISTVEHDVTPRFFVDLRKLEAKYAPDLAQLMQAALAAARRKEAEQVAREEPIMQKKLRERKASPDIVVPPRKNAGIESNLLQAKLDQSKQNEKVQLRTAQNLQSALTQAQANKGAHLPPLPEKTPVAIPANALAKLPDLSIPALPRVEMPEKKLTPKVQIPEEKPKDNKIPVPNIPLVAIPTQMPAKGPKIIPDVKADLRVPDINAALSSAKDKAKAAVNQVVPAMDAVLTYLRKLPSSKDSTTNTNTEVTLETASIIEWDKWHAGFAQLARQPILRCVDECGNPSGNNTVEITVWPNRHVEVKLARSGNATFDKAILKAYQSLDGNAALAYPKGSRRSSVSFLIDNKHEGAGRPSAVNSESSVGDKEILRQSFSSGLKKK